MKNKSVALISLGCAKNLVDSENMLAILKKSGYRLTEDLSKADAAVINTCGFTDPAKEEAIGEILSAAEYKKTGKLRALVVTGCLAQRYQDDILTELPEIDAILGTGSYQKIAECLDTALAGNAYAAFDDISASPLDFTGRLVSTPSYTAYLKVAEGCDNHCAYCVIPSLRGRFRSRPLEELLREAETLAQSGVSELILIAQDTTRYGTDLYGERRLPALLKGLCKIPGLRRVLLHYLYPDEVDDLLIDTIASEEKIANYFDIPVQHASDRVLSSMNRRGGEKEIRALIKKIREKIPGAILRTTVIVGYPTEREEDFLALCDFAKEIKFDRLGVFSYSPQEGTKGYALEQEHFVPDEEKERRREILLRTQSMISLEKNKEKIGKTLTALCEGFDSGIEMYAARGEGDSPDVDTKIYFHSDREVNPGDFLEIQIYDCDEYDLYGVAAASDESGQVVS